MNAHIHPIFDRALERAHKENLLGQRGMVAWFTGLSGSGKSTLALALERALHAEGILTQLLDGDNMRTGLCKDLGFSEADRTENIRRIAETAKLFAGCGVVTLCAFVSPTVAIREQARNLIGADDFFEIYVNASLESCEQRDVKGLYKKARAGQIPDFTGITSPFEAPENPFLEVRTDQHSLDTCLATLFTAILPIIRSSQLIPPGA